MRPDRLAIVRLAARTLLALACGLLLAAAPAAAMPYGDDDPPTAAHQLSAPPTIVKETVVRPDTGFDATTYALVAAGLLLCLLASGYAGARIAARPRTGSPSGR